MPDNPTRPAGAGLSVVLTRRRAVWAGATAVVLSVVAVPAVWWSRADGATPAAGRTIPVATAEVVRTDMSAAESLSGRLGYGPPAPVKGRGEGTVTWLPKPGATVRRGGTLYRVDDEAVPLFYGSLPLYRPLSEPGTVGRDVRVVARNLQSLGYAIGRQPGTGERVTWKEPAPAGATPPPAGSGTPPPAGSGTPPPAGSGTPPPGGSEAPPPKRKTVSVRVGKGEGVLTTALIKAIKRWQTDLGRPATGTIAPGDVVVLAGAVRVDAVTATVGDEVAAELLAVTATTKVITVSLDAAEAGAIERGDQVTVLLPGEKTTPGTVTAVGTDVTGGGPDDPDAAPKVTATVTPKDPEAVARIDSADVAVQVAAETREGVLAVPVGALVALSEGGYAVQLAGGGLVAVEVGMFAKGLVEVTGDGLAEGVSVVTAS